MICYMPFSYIEDRLLDKLAATFGTVTIHCPSLLEVSDHMLAAVQEKKLDLRSAPGVQPDLLVQAIREFQAWADLHGGEIADLAGLSKSMQGHLPLVDETNPTSIGDQIRHFGEQGPRDAADPVFQAALFLSMAQQYDQHQAAVSRDLGAVLTMEQAMLARLAGDAEDLDQGADALSTLGDSGDSSDTGAFMTAKRVQCWAELACKDTGSPTSILYLTSSPAVLEHLQNHFGQIQGPFGIDLTMVEDGESGHANLEISEALKALAFADDPAAVTAGCFQKSRNAAHHMNLTIYALAGISPSAFPQHLVSTGRPAQQGMQTGPGPVNTLIGLLEK
jgi:hypothetical protein